MPVIVTVLVWLELSVNIFVMLTPMFPLVALLEDPPPLPIRVTEPPRSDVTFANIP